MRNDVDEQRPSDVGSMLCYGVVERLHLTVMVMCASDEDVVLSRVDSERVCVFVCRLWVCSTRHNHRVAANSFEQSPPNHNNITHVKREPCEMNFVADRVLGWVTIAYQHDQQCRIGR